MRKILLAGAAFAVAAAAPVVAESVQPHHPGMMNKTETRADVQGDVAKMFTRLDANKDGFVTDAEVQAAQARHAEKRQDKMEKRAEHYDPAKMFARLDSNKDGKVTKAEAEAVRASHAEAKGKAPRGADHLFARADSNKDGKVTLAEAQSAALQHFDRADANRDGKVTPEERKAMRQSMHGQRKG